MVDAAVVMIENAHKHIEAWQRAPKPETCRRERQRVIGDAAIQVGPALFLVLIITFSFIPVFTLEAGRVGCSRRSPSPKPMRWPGRPYWRSR
jgi:Cu(I)/Ag(I) efflux system membrane protein CusA/SilA